MNKPDKSGFSQPRPQFRLKTLMAFTSGLCAVSAVLAALRIHPLELLFAAVFFSIGVAVFAVQLELICVAAGIRDRQRNDSKPRR